MAKYTFKQFQAEYPDNATCLVPMMEIQYGGEETHCAHCDKRTKFHQMTKRQPTVLLNRAGRHPLASLSTR